MIRALPQPYVPGEWKLWIDEALVDFLRLVPGIARIRPVSDTKDCFFIRIDPRYNERDFLSLILMFNYDPVPGIH